MAFSVTHAQYRLPQHHTLMASRKAASFKPSSSECSSRSLKMPTLSGTFGAGFLGNAFGNRF